jgi:hypothetical protein
MTHLFLAAAACNRDTVIFLPHWWEYLKTSQDALGQCAVEIHFPNDLLAVGLAVLDILLRVIGFVAVISIIIAGIQHLFTGGNPEKAASARKRLFASIVGLLIALLATAVVTFLGKQLA